MKVLIIDDCPEAIALVKVRLSKDGLDVISANCGAAGLEAVRSQRPDLILLDVDMPDKSGFEVCRELKDDSKLSMIPVVFLSGADSAEDKVKGLNIGAVDYITKPFDAFELQARVNASLRTKYMQDLLIDRAHVDPLTGLANRNTLSERLGEEWARVRRHGRPMSIIVAEIDRFERINDAHGRTAGDRALQVVSETIAASCRRVDIPTRCKGPKFAIITPDEVAENAAVLALRCRDRIRTMQLKVNDEEIWVTASFGVADTEDKTSLEELRRAADKALAQARAAGGNRVVTEQQAAEEPANELQRQVENVT